MAAISRRRARIARLRRLAATRAAGMLGGALGSTLGSLLPSSAVQAATLPEDRADAMFHVYDGGGVEAIGPALLVRKSLLDKISLSASYYVDAVSNASIDVVTTASPYDERRTETGVGLDYAVRDALISVSATRSKEPDYIAEGTNFDVSQETFGGMTTVNLGFSRAVDQVGQRGTPGFFDSAKHWRYRLGVTQILTPRWIASLNLEAMSDEGFLGSPYRAARVFGAAVPERNPRTRNARAVKVRSLYDVGSRTSVRGELRYFWDTWDITAVTAEAGLSRHVNETWLGDAYLRYHTQGKALFYSNNATSETLFVSRNRQLSTFKSVGLGAKLSYYAGRFGGRWDVRVNGAVERTRFDFSDFTDIRTGQPYQYDANVLQLFLSATF